MNRILICIGLILIVVGLGWAWLSQIHLGRLPGDIIINRPGFKLYAPITTMLLVSVVLTVIFWILKK